MENQRRIWLMKRLFYIFVLFIYAMSLQATPPIPSAVSSFYDSMNRLTKASTYAESDVIYRSMIKLSYAIKHGSASGENMRNDFQPFTYDERSSSHNDVLFSFTLYIDKLQKYIYEDKVMNVSYTVLYNDYYGGAIDFSGGKTITQKTIMETVVEKTYTINHQTKTFRDTLLTHIPTNTICQFYNINVVDEKDIIDLKKQAARYYYLKQYVEAYRCFEKILTINSDDAETLYRLGLMTYYGEGCNMGSKRQHHNKGKEYMEKATRSDVRLGFKDKAEIVLHNWKYGSSLM